MIIILNYYILFLAQRHSQSESESIDHTAAEIVTPAAIAIVVADLGIDILVKQLMLNHTTKLSLISH